MKNLYITLGILAALLASHFYAYQKGIAARKAEETEITLAISKSREEAAKGAAEAISNIEITNKTIYQKVQREVLTNTVYAECQHTPERLRDINNAIKPSNSVGNRELP